MSDPDEFPEVTELLRSEPVDIDPDARAKAVSAALDAYGSETVVTTHTAGTTSTRTAHRKRSSNIGLGMLGAAAAVVVVLGVGVASLSGSGGSSQDAMSSAEAVPTTTMAPPAAETSAADSSAELSESAGTDTARMPQAGAAGAEEFERGPAQLGTFATADLLANAVEALVQQDQVAEARATTVPCPGSESPIAAEDQFVWAASIGSDPVWAIASVSRASGENSITIVSDPGCVVLLRGDR